MVLYMNMAILGQASIEFNRDFGMLPVFKLNVCLGEYILDLPYIRTIYTPPGWTYEKEKQRERQRIENKQRDSKGIDEDRPGVSATVGTMLPRDSD